MAKTINLTDKNDTRNGGSADEIINAKGGNDTVTGGGGNDKLDGGSGNDKLTGGTGNDTLIGGEGNDTATYAGVLEDDNGNRLYAFELDENGQLLVTDLNGKDGMDSVVSVEFLKFKDQTVAVSDIIDELTTTPPLLSLDPTSQSVNEGSDGGITEVTLDLSLSSPSNQPVSVHVSTQEGTAKSQSDYIPLDTVITFDPGETDQTLTVSIAADSVKEGTEQFTVKLDQPQGLEIEGNGVATIGIIDDDGDSATSSQVGIQISDVKSPEGNTGSKTVTVTVSLTGSSPNKVTVDYATLDGSATAGSDYVKKSGTLIFNPGETKKTVNITINGDTQSEGDETFSLNLSNPQGAKLNTSKATITIQDDDGGVQTSANHAPIPKDDNFSNLPAGQQVSKTGADLLANDQDPDGDPLTVTKVADASGGVVSLNDKGQILFTPSEGAQSASYSYTVSDGKGGTATANVLLQFAASDNHNPVAQDDSFTGLPGNQAATQSIASLLKNDSDPDGDGLTMTRIDNIVNGAVSPSSDSITFTPKTGATEGSYQYTVSDGHGGSATATVRLGFVLPNQAPDAVDDSFTGQPANQPLVIAAADLLKNDTDPDKNPLTVSNVSDAQNGTVALKDGQITFIPTQGATSASFQYLISDGQGGSDSATVTLGFASPAATTPPSTSSASLPPDNRQYDLELPLTDKADKLNGSALNEKFLGMGGNDQLDGKDGYDHLEGNDGNDTLLGGNGDDYLLGGAGNDSIDAGDGNDSMDGGTGNDTLSGGDGDHVIVDMDGNNHVYFGAGNNQINCGSGNDYISAIPADGDNNAINSGGGDDIITVDGYATIYAGDGDDDVAMGTYSGEYADPKGGEYMVHGDAGNDSIDINLLENGISAYGDDGNDKMSGYGALYGGAGSDTINAGVYGNGGEGNDRLYTYSSPSDIATLEGGGGVDTMSSNGVAADYRFTQAGDSGVGEGNRDIITDFDTGSSDVIDLGYLASAGKPLSFIAAAPFSGKAGEVNFTLDVPNQQTIVALDLNGDAKADMEIQLTGINILSADDFILALSAP